MHPALLTLVRLKSRANRRRVLRGLRTVKGVLYAVVVCGLFAAWLGPSLAYGLMARPSDPALIRSLAPTALLIFCLLNLLSIKPGSGVVFRPAEVDFLFPGPFLRRDLLLYKLLEVLIGSLGLAVFFSVFLLPYVASWAAGVIGAFLGLLFIQLFHLNATLLAGALAERVFSTLRRAALLAAVAAIGLGLAFAGSVEGESGVLGVAARFRASWISVLVLAPFEVFGRTVAAHSWYPELAGWGTIGALINAGMVLLVLRFDTNFLEASTAASQKLYERVQRARRGAPWLNAAGSGARGRLPPLPWMGGAGPIAWRQMLTALRSLRGVVLMVAVFVAGGVLPLVLSGRGTGRTISTVLAIVGSMSLFYVPMVVRYDFRGDLDQMELLKTLPIPATPLAIGELLAPVLATSLLQLVLIWAAGFLEPSLLPYLAIAALFALPVNALIYALENVTFLLFPYRLGVTSAADVPAFVRQMLIMFLKFLVLLVAAGLAGGIGGAAYYLAGRSSPLRSGHGSPWSAWRPVSCRRSRWRSGASIRAPTLPRDCRRDAQITLSHRRPTVRRQTGTGAAAPRAAASLPATHSSSGRGARVAREAPAPPGGGRQATASHPACRALR